MNFNKVKYLFRIGGYKAIRPVSIQNPEDLEVTLLISETHSSTEDCDDPQMHRRKKEEAPNPIFIPGSQELQIFYRDEGQAFRHKFQEAVLLYLPYEFPARREGGQIWRSGYEIFHHSQRRGLCSIPKEQIVEVDYFHDGWIAAHSDQGPNAIGLLTHVILANKMNSR